MRNLLILSDVAGLNINDKFTNLVRNLINSGIYTPVYKNPAKQVFDAELIDFNDGQILTNFEDLIREVDCIVLDARSAITDKAFYYELGLAMSRMPACLLILCDETELQLQKQVNDYLKARKVLEMDEYSTLEVLADGKEVTEDNQVNLSNVFVRLGEAGYPNRTLVIDQDIEPDEPYLRMLLGMFLGYTKIEYNRTDLDGFEKFIIDKW